MSVLSKPSSAFQVAVIYITIGALTDVWAGIWHEYMRHYPPERLSTWYWCYGFLLTGFTLVVIGLGIGRIGRSARNAELPPEEVTPAVTNAEQNAAARAPIIAPVNPVTSPVIGPRDVPVAAPAPGPRTGQVVGTH